MMPEFVNSEWFVDEPDNWHLKPGAPPEIVKEFEEWMADHGFKEDENIIVDLTTRPVFRAGGFFIAIHRLPVVGGKQNRNNRGS